MSTYSWTVGYCTSSMKNNKECINNLPLRMHDLVSVWRSYCWWWRIFAKNLVKILMKILVVKRKNENFFESYIVSWCYFALKVLDYDDIMEAYLAINIWWALLFQIYDFKEKLKNYVFNFDAILVKICL